MFIDFKTVKEILGKKCYNDLPDSCKELIENYDIDEVSFSFKFSNGEEVRVTRKIQRVLIEVWKDGWKV